MKNQWERYRVPAVSEVDLTSFPVELERFMKLRAAASHPQQLPKFVYPDAAYKAFYALQELDAYAYRSGNGAIIGAMTLDMEPWDDRERVWLDTLALAPRNRKAGIGRRALILAAQETESAGLSRIEASAVRSAVPFYTRCGFETRGDESGELVNIVGSVDSIQSACSLVDA